MVYSTAFTLQGLRVQFYFRSPDADINAARFAALRAHREKFEHALGEPAVWDAKPGKKAAAVFVNSQFDNVEDIERWPAMFDWLLATHTRFRNAVEAVGGVASLG